MPLQRYPDGCIARAAPISSGGFGDGVSAPLKASVNPETECCCPDAPVKWGIHPCSMPYDERTAANALWISEARKIEIWQDALDAGILPGPNDCVSSTGAPFQIEPADCCDGINWPWALVLWNNATRACYQLSYAICVENPVPAFFTSDDVELVDDLVFVVGDFCCESPCVCDEFENPDPPDEPEPEDPVPPGSLDCCGNPTTEYYEIEFAGMGECACYNSGASWYKFDASSLNLTVPLLLDCTQIFEGYKMRVWQYDDAGCTSLVGTTTTSCTINVEFDVTCPLQWLATITATNPVVSPFNVAACFGNCDGGTAANTQPCIGGTVTIRKRAPLP